MHDISASTWVIALTGGRFKARVFSELILSLSLQLLGQILDLCTMEQVGMLRATCRSFAISGLMEVTAQRRCQAITRAKGLEPTAGCDPAAMPCVTHQERCQDMMQQ